MSKVYRENSSNGFNSKPIIQSYLNILLLKTQEIFSTSKYSISKTTQQVLFLIDREYINNPTSELIAEKLNINLKTLNSTLSKEIGKSLKSLIKEKILIECKKSLLLSSEPIKTIAYDFNFSDPSNFNKFFKKEVGITAKEFRAQHLA